MKKFLFSFLMMFSFSLHAQKSLVEKIDGDILALQTILKMVNGGLRIELTSGDTIFDAKDDYNFEKKRNTVINKVDLEKFFKTIDISTNSKYPYSLIVIDKDEFDLAKLIGQENSYFGKNQDYEPVYTPVSFTFVDGSKMKATSNNYINQAILSDQYKATEKDEDGTEYDFVDEEKMAEEEQFIWRYSSFKEAFLVKSPKPVKSVTFKIDFAVAEINTYKPAQNEVKTPFGIIKIEKITGNKVQVILPDEDGKDVITIQAYYKDGRLLKQKNYSSTTYLTPEKKKYYEFYVEILNKAKLEVQKKNIKIEGELTKYLENAVKVNPVEKKELTKYKSAIFTFSGPVSAVDFLVTSGKNQKFTYETIANFEYDNEKYFMAEAVGTDKLGIINKEGKWVIQPTLSENFRPWNNYFYRDQIDDFDETYWLNPKTEKLEKMDYKLYTYEIFDEKYVKIEKKVNGLYGLADINTGKIALPMQYERLNFTAGKFWQASLDGKEGILNRNFKTALPFKFQTADADENFFYTRSENKQDVYNLQGENITKGNFSGISGQFSNGLLLVYETKTLSNGNINSYYYYIDEKGDKKLDVKMLGLTDQKPFEDGLAQVKCTDGKWGFMNTAGKLEIACQYRWTYSFYRSSHLAEAILENGNSVLIDKSGKIIKKFTSDITDRRRSSEDRASRLDTRDGKKHNEYGEEVER